MVPGFVTMIGPKEHMSGGPWSRIGFPPTSFVGASGVHGPVGTGTQGQGVGIGLPIPAGFAGELHTPNGGMFVIGTKSITVPTGLPSKSTGLGMGVGTKTDGAAPNAHCSWAPATTGSGMSGTLLHRAGAGQGVVLVTPG